MKREFILSVNFHVWEPCNMGCKFCFATFQDVKQSILPSGHLCKEQAIQLVKELAGVGFRKITFAGGEPTLSPWLGELIKTAKQAGMTTMIVTNGSKLDDLFLKQNKDDLDWIAISIDSLNPNTNIEMGRAISGKSPLSTDYYKSLVEKVIQFGYGLKINTVVNSKNYQEDMNEFIRFARPLRWKILQVLPIQGQNDDKIDDFEISETEFKYFINNHKGLAVTTNIVTESNKQMKGSYAMVDPAGRFFDNATGTHNYSRSILEVGAAVALKDVNFDFQKFSSRGGIYDWERKETNLPTRITLSGMVASGKSTIGRILAERLNYKFVSIGNKTRAFAKQKGMSIVDFQKECLQNPELDIQIDQEFSEECNSQDRIVIDYRLGFRFIKNGYHIFLKISEVDAIERLKNANRENETFHTIAQRKEIFRKQFENSYGVDYTDECNYNLVIKIDKDSTSESIADLIIASHLSFASCQIK